MAVYKKLSNTQEREGVKDRTREEKLKKEKEEGEQEDQGRAVKVISKVKEGRYREKTRMWKRRGIIGKWKRNEKRSMMEAEHGTNRGTRKERMKEDSTGIERKGRKRK